MHQAGRVLLALLSVALLVALPVGAYEEAEAAALWREQHGSDIVVATGHEPEAVAAGEQFAGTLQLVPDHGVEEVHYQVCIVADRCIISPRPATQVNGTTWRYDTADFRLPDALGGQYHRWEAGQWIGIQWFLRLEGSEELVEFPRPWASDDPRCAAEPVACQATHYLTFRMQGEEHDAPAPGMSALLVLAAAVLLVEARRRGRHG